MITDNVREVLDAVRGAALRSGRRPDEITLVAVSKTRPAAEVDKVLSSGLVHLGENRVQEAVEKRPEVRGGGVWHLVGHLQSNKAKKAAGLFEWIDSVDSMKLADILSESAVELEKTLNVLIQVNISGEHRKSGVDPSELRDLASHVAGKNGLRLRGLMTIGSFGADESEARGEFRKMRILFDSIRESALTGNDFDTLSMGMSGDYEAAIEEGANMVRVGTAIFGTRD